MSSKSLSPQVTLHVSSSHVGESLASLHGVWCLCSNGQQVCSIVSTWTEWEKVQNHIRLGFVQIDRCILHDNSCFLFDLASKTRLLHAKHIPFVPLFWPLTHHYHGSKRYLTKSKYLFLLMAFCSRFSFEGWKQARYKSSKGHKKFCIICFWNMETKPFIVLGKAFLLPGWSGGCICPRGQIVCRVCWNVNFGSHLK